MDRTTAAYSLRVRVLIPHRPGALGALCAAIGAAGGNIRSLAGFDLSDEEELDQELVVDCSSEQHQQAVLASIADHGHVTLAEHEDRTFALHEGGKLEVVPTAPLADADDLSMAYTPGVARVCRAIQDDPEEARRLTIKRGTVAVLTDGTAVLGLGDIGAAASLPVMEGKAALFKSFAGVDAFPIAVDTTDVDEIVETAIRIAPVFGGINLEDIASPACFEVEDRLREALDIPVFHDDQHGTAVVALAALENALEITGGKLADQRIVISGAGAAGVAVTQILHAAGASDIVVCDSGGALHPGRSGLSDVKQRLAADSNPDGATGSLAECLRGADVFIGVSAPDLLTGEQVARMADRPVVFALANPDPEIRPEDVISPGAIIATGRSDYPNQINNVLAFPGIFRGALDVGARAVTESMKVAAADAIAGCVTDRERAAGKVVPDVFDPRVVEAVGAAVADAAREAGVATVAPREEVAITSRDRPPDVLPPA